MVKYLSNIFIANMQSICNILTEFRKIKVYSATARWNHSTLHTYTHTYISVNGKSTLVTR